MIETNERAGRHTDNLPLALFSIILTVLALSLGDALIKLTSSDFVLWQIFVLRSAIAIPVLILLLALSPANSVLPKAAGWTVARSLMLVVMWICYYMALPHLPLSVAAAGYYTLPLFITLFSALFSKERVSLRGWFAVMLGFLGILLILRPSAEGFNLYALLPVASATLYAFAMILTRTKCRSEHPLTLSLVLNIAFIIVGAVAALAIAAFAPDDRSGFLSGPWTEMTVENWMAMTLLAASILIGSIGAAIAYQNGPPAMVGTFDFAYVGFAVLWGLVFFANLPDAISIAGISMIVVAGILAVRE